MGVEAAETDSRQGKAIRNSLPSNEVFGGFDSAISPKSGKLLELCLVLGNLDLQVAHLARSVRLTRKSSREYR